MHSTLGNTLAAVSQKEPEKGLTDEEKEHLAAVLRRVRDLRFEGNATSMAKALDIGQSQISQILKGKRTDRSAGIPVLKRIRSYTGLTLDQLIGLPPIQPLVLEPPPPSADMSEAERLAWAVIEGGRAKRRPTSAPKLLAATIPKGLSDDSPRPRRR